MTGPGSQERAPRMAAKRCVLAVLVAAALSLGAWAGISTRRHWDWLEAQHLAGIALLEVLFIVVAALSAIELSRREWEDVTPAGVARRYLTAFGAMLAVFFVVGVLLLVFAWAWAFLEAAVELSFDRYPWFMICGLVGGLLIAYWRKDLHALTKRVLRRLTSLAAPTDVPLDKETESLRRTHEGPVSGSHPPQANR